MNFIIRIKKRLNTSHNLPNQSLPIISVRRPIRKTASNSCFFDYPYVGIELFCVYVIIYL